MCLLSMVSYSNNVVVQGDIRIDPDSVINNVAIINVKVAWDNSWRDEFNHDAVYLFFKYKIDGSDKEWHHAYIAENPGNRLSNKDNEKYDFWLSSSSGNVKKNEGVFLYRAEKASGAAEIDVRLMWDITTAATQVRKADFSEGRVYLSAMAIETVYVPRGAYRIGDTRSTKTFRNNFITFHENWDVTSSEYNCTSSNENKNANPPSFAVNRMNDLEKSTTNAWVGEARGENHPDGKEQYWSIDFGMKNGKLLPAAEQGKTVRTIAIAGLNPPTVWKLQGRNEGVDWGDPLTVLYEGTAADWDTDTIRTYPPRHAIKLKENIKKYRYYRISIPVATTVAPIIKTVAMSELDIEDRNTKVIDNSVLIAEPTTRMHPQIGLYVAGDRDTDASGNALTSETLWKDSIPASYPNGYGASYVMKYELSQEQYVVFLNKLNRAQQGYRTIGQPNLQALEAGHDTYGGDYVFGISHKTPSYRNGIVLARRENTTDPVVFANDLKKDEAGVNQEGDGQALACNYLTAEDMLAYADWCGLRPLTEMEYEKISRPLYPAIPLANEYGWNTQNYTPAQGLLQPGKTLETVTSGNANSIGADAQIGGPLRCGVFGTDVTTQEQSGASFWGAMELSGNLAELYYNAKYRGRMFAGLHGDGEITADKGLANVTADKWPVHHNAFSKRGGSFLDNKMYTSDRTYDFELYQNMIISGPRDSAMTITFRLGRTAPVLTSNSAQIYLQNGLQTFDTICSGDDYKVSGNIPNGLSDSYAMAWFVSENLGKTWELVDNAQDKDLKIVNLRNTNTMRDAFKEYWYKRHTYSNLADSKSNTIRIRVVNMDTRLSDLRDTVDVYNHSNSIRMRTVQNADIQWHFNTKKINAEYTIIAGKEDLMYWEYTDFDDSGQRINEEVPVVITSNIMKHCLVKDTIRVFVGDYPTVRAGLENFSCGDIMTDQREHKDISYRTIQIGGLCWMAENLNYGAVDGVGICYNDKEENCKRYGRLYTWREAVNNATNSGEVQGVCPEGWRMPTTAEWKNLFTTIGTKNLKASLRENAWNFVGEQYIGTNDSRFSAMPGGVKAYNANTTFFGGYNGWRDIGVAAWWWTGSVNKNEVWGRYCVTGYNYHNDYNSSTADLPNCAYIKNALECDAGTSPFFKDVRDCNSVTSYTSTTGSPEPMYSKYYLSVRCVKK